MNLYIIARKAKIYLHVGFNPRQVVVPIYYLEILLHSVREVVPVPQLSRQLVHVLKNHFSIDSYSYSIA